MWYSRYVSAFILELSHAYIDRHAVAVLGRREPAGLKPAAGENFLCGVRPLVRQCCPFPLPQGTEPAVIGRLLSGSLWTHSVERV